HPRWSVITAPTAALLPLVGLGYEHWPCPAGAPLSLGRTGRGTYVPSAKPRLCLADRIAWVIFAASVTAMFDVLYTARVDGHGATVADLLDRVRFRTAIFCAAAASAISGPMLATIGQLIACRAQRPSKMKQNFVGLDL